MIAEGEIEEWNRSRPALRLTPSQNDVDEMEPEFTIRTFGDEVFAKLQILRARMEPTERWPAAVVRFSTA